MHLDPQTLRAIALAIVLLILRQSLDHWLAPTDRRRTRLPHQAAHRLDPRHRPAALLIALVYLDSSRKQPIRVVGAVLCLCSNRRRP